MDWTQFILMFMGMIGLFAWNRVEARADWRHMDAKLASTDALIQAIHQEMKDFHGRLCAIEERNKRQ